MSIEHLKAMRPFERGVYISERARTGWVPTAAWLIEVFGVSRATAFRMLRQARHLWATDASKRSPLA